MVSLGAHGVLYTCHLILQWKPYRYDVTTGLQEGHQRFTTSLDVLER
uniref:Uncharacterized protein n=1 Tax=Arundo donax TaxID=35708 RepID=A0A0A9AHS3_ARUDO